MSDGGAHCSNSVHWNGTSRGAGGVSPGFSVLGEDMTSFGLDVSPLERLEQHSVVGEFGSADWPFISALGREKLATEAGGGHADDMASPSELTPEDVGLNGVDSGVGESGGVGGGNETIGA